MCIMATINISLPASMYKDAKAALKSQGYASISELIRSALRKVLYPRLTVNGFTPEFEDQVLRAAAEPIEDSVQWDGKGSFTDFVLSHPPKHAQHQIHKRVSQPRKTAAKKTSRTGGAHQSNRSMVSKESARYAFA